MKSLLRLLVFALVLATSGVFQSLACGSIAEIGCADGDEGRADCADCGADCGICIVCPLSVAPSVVCTAPVATVAILEPLAAPLPEQPANAHAIGIFQPPKV